jgi:peroxiredoxin Q/BCP
MTLTIGEQAPEFSLPASTGKTIHLKDFTGQKLVLYFYPKDDTPGCTTEACDFRDHLNILQKNNIAVLGVSKDSLKAHTKFIEKHGLTFPLLSDEEGTMVAAYGVWVEKSMYGKKYMGIERATFLIDEQGVIRHIWRNVKVTGHVAEIIESVRV